jgi:hypothetical protein
MAIKLSKTTDSNISVSSSYARIEGILLSNKKSISFRVRFYNDQTLPNESSTVPFFDEETYSCSYDLTKTNPIEQAYAYLKTLPEFSNAVDC